MPQAPLVEELEPRILLSAGIHGALLGDVLSDAVTADHAQLNLVSSLVTAANDNVAGATAIRNELIFVDAATPDYERLVQQLLAGAGDGLNIDVIVIDSGSDGIDQISQALMGYTNLDAIHFISHGTDGAVQLGNTWLDNAALADYAGLIGGWADALNADADLLFYGCDLAAGADGRGLIAELAVLTGADIAASNDLTGHAALGGNWTLEHQTGVVESQVVFGSKLQQNWAQTLSVTVDSSSSGTDINTDNITISHTTSGTERLILVAIAFEPNGTETVDTITYNGVSLTLVGSDTNSDGKVRVEIWALVAPDTGTHDVVVDLTAAGKGITVGVMTFNGVDQGTPLGNYYSTEGDGSTASVAVGSAAGDLVFGFLGQRKGSDATPGAGQTEHEDVNIGNILGAISTETGAPSVTTSWALDNSDKWIATGVSINAATNTPQLWLAGESSPLVEEFGGDGFSLENPTTIGTFSPAFDLSIAEPSATANVNALHYVGSTINLSGIGITSMTVNPGDIIFSVDGSDTLGGIAVTDEDLVVFSPTTPGDYSSGTFTMLAAGLGAGKDITAFSLVETDTVVPGSGTLAAGDFIYVAGSGGDMRRISHYDTSTGLSSFILDGDVDATVGFKPGANVITGIDLIETDITIGGRNLTAGQILISLTDDDTSVGNLSGNIGVADEDIFVVDLVSASDFSASLLFDGSDVGYPGDVHALSIAGTAASPGSDISGTVYEDINGDGNLLDGIGIGGVDVDLYLDDGDGVIDAGDTLVDSTTTDGSGNYTLTGSGDGTYWVVVDSTTIAPDAGYNTGYDLGDVWAEQTWGSTGAVSFDGSFGYLGTAGIFYGGMQYEVSDDALSLTTAEHVTRAIVTGANVISVDSAFSFSVVTRTGDGDDDAGADRSMQGSLRQFIQNSNAVVGIQTSQFAMSTSDSGYNGTGNGEFTIQVGAAGYAAMTDTVILDATTQNGYSGSPLIELDGTNAIGSSAGLILRTNNSLVRGFMVHSFPDDGIEIDGQTGFGDNNTVQNNWVGINATGSAAGNIDNGIIMAFAAAGNQIGGTGLNEGNVVAGNLGNGIALRDIGTINNIVEGNYIGVGSDGVTAIGNQIDGVYIYSGAIGNRIGGSAANAGNVISGNGQNGITIWDATTSLNIVIGNRIGTDYTGTVAVGNTWDGIHIGSGASNNTIGGTAPGAGNVISGNFNDGIEFANAGTTGNAALGNYIGTNAAGTAALANLRHGVVLFDGASNTTIGGTIAGARNLISGNSNSGIIIAGNGLGTTINNSIYGNYIGTNAAGTAAIANTIGVNIINTASDNFIGGGGANEGNLISGNLISGIAINGLGTDNNTIQGNLIGTDVSGNTALGNVGAGINVQSSASGTNIGGTAAGEGNVISGNSRGIQLFSATDGTTVQGNNIGVGTDGVTTLGNINDGIIISDSSNNMIGGTVAGAGNIIANNGGDGVSLISASGINNAILGNSIYGNAQLGIDLAGGTEDAFGVTDNDAGDGDSGPNDLQNYPLLISANTDESSNVYIAGRIQAAASTTYRIEFFINSSQDASGHGEGETYLGYIDVTTDATGAASFSATFFATVAAGSFITTTATAPGLSTSEFSADVVSLDMGTLVVDTSSDSVDGNTSSIAALLANRGTDERISLREAILATNATANAGGPDQIHFNLQLDDPNHFYYQDDGIAGSLSLVSSTTEDDSDIADFDPDYPVVGHSWYRIQPTSALPLITDAIVIDGYTQLGASANTLPFGTNAVMKIEINGDLSGGSNAFQLAASDSTLRGFVINGNFNIGIVVSGNNNTISGNYIGTDITGTQAPTNNFAAGILVGYGASNNMIGGVTPADRNVVSGTTSHAIWLSNATTQGNTIRGNYIGTTALGTAAIANLSNGVVLTDGTHDNTIQDNVISGNNTGILLDGTISAPDSNTIVGNLIGTDATGVFAVANAVGIWLQAGVTNTTIGGTNASQRNIISGNTTYGTRIEGAGTSGNVVLGNYIGTDISGTVGLGNGLSGISISNFASANTIGGTAAGARNILAANTVSGVELANGAFGNFVQGNYIGVDVSGTTAMGQGFAGVRIISGATGNTVGGIAPGAGNVISGNSNGVYISDAGTIGNIVQGNLIGTDFTGTVDVGNTDDGVEIANGASGNLIGGSVAAARNIISGNNGDGVSIRGAGTSSNMVFGNYIGTDLSGNVALGNGAAGINISQGATNNEIGDAGGSSGNVISGNTSHGIVIRDVGTSANTVEGNYIGANAAGTAALGNGLQGVLINQGASGNFVGGTAAGARNVISGNLSTGVFIQNAGTSANVVLGNYIGTNAAGDAAIGNGSGGVRISDFATGNTIGGTTAGTGNLISGNSWGVQIFANAFGNFVQGNLIGTDWTGTSALGNTGQGVTIQSDANNNMIGGTVAGAANVIAFNASTGVQLTADAGTGNSILGNSIHSNAGLGIDIMPWGVDANVVTLTSAVTDGIGTITIGGTITGAAAGTTYRIELFGNVTGDPSGSGEGEIYLGFVDVLTDGLGNATFSVPLAAVIPPGYLISATATDPAGNTSEFAANIVAISLPPVLDLDADNSSGATGADYVTGYTEDGGPVLIADADGTLVDPDTMLQWMTVTITNLLDGLAELLAADTSGTSIVASYDALTGILTLSGADTAANYQQVLRTITYDNASDDPDLASRIIEFVANDGESSSNLATTTLSITAVNDAPTLTPATPSLPPISEDGISNGGIQISTLLGGSVSDPDTGAVQGIAVTGLNSGNGAWEYSTDGGLTWIAVGSVSDSNALLLRANDYIRFVPDTANADTASFDFRAWDQTSGLFGNKVDTSPNGGISAFSSATDTADITVNAVNDAPMLTVATPSLPTINEDDVNNGGILISTLLGGSVTDVDSAALGGIAVTGLISGNGTWEYSTDGGFTWIAVGSVSDSNALLLRATDYIRFVPDGENADAASFDFRAWDQTSGLFGSKVDTSPNGGISAFSSATDTADMTVNAVNDAPVLTAATPSLPTINEDDINNGGILISTLLGGSVSDVDSAAVGGIAVTGLISGNGTWEYSTDGGLTWIAVGSVADSNALLLRATDYIRFVPDGENADAASFDFRAWDQTSGLFGTKVDTSLNGGVTAFSSAIDAADITVSGINEAPVLTPATPGLPPIDEDDIGNGGILISTLLGSSVSDLDNGALEGIAVTGLNSGNGTWEYSTDGGLTWIAVGAVSDSNALLLRATDYIRFVPDAENADTASFTFRAWDQTSGLFGSKVDTSPNGGITAFSTATDTADISVGAVNDAPVLIPAAPSLPTIDEDNINNNGVAVSTLLGGSATDVDTGSLIGIAITGLSSGNGTWQYSLDGIAWIDVPAVSDNAALVLGTSHRIRFVPDGDNGDTASFTFRAWDSTGGPAGSLMDTTPNGGVTPFSTGIDTASIVVMAINDIPTTTGLNDLAVDEDGAPVVIDLYAAFSDIEDLVSQLTFSITGNTDPSLFAGITIDPVLGTLTLDLAPDANGQTTITVRAVDTGGAQVETSFVLDLAAINDTPFTTGPGALSTLEDAPAATFDLYTLFGDIDDLNTALTFTIVANDNTTLATASIDAATGTLNMNFAADMSGSATLTLRATDASGAFVDSNFLVTVDPVDDAVINLLPGSQSVSYSEFVLFSQSNGNSISVSDIDSTNITVSLSVPNGLLTLGNTTGLTFSAGDGTADVQMTFTGSVSDVNAALDGLKYQPLADFDGVVALQVATWSPDLPPAERAPVSAETINIVVLDAIAPQPLSIADPVDPPVPVESNTEKDDVVEAEAAVSTPAPATTSNTPASEFAPVPQPVLAAAVVVTPANEIPAPDRGTVSPREFLSNVTRMLLQLSSDGKLPAFVINDAVWDAIDAMKTEMAGLDDADSANHQLLVTVSTGLTLTLSAGFVSWLMRAGSLLTSLLSTTPLWQRFDPLPVLDSRRRDDEDETEKDAAAVAAIFGSNP